MTRAHLASLLAAALISAAGGCGTAPRTAAPAARPSGRPAEPDLLSPSGPSPLVVWADVDANGQADILIGAARDRDSTAGEGGPRADTVDDVLLPRRLNPTPSSAVAGRQVGPRGATLPDGRAVVAWVDRARDPTGDILAVVVDPRSGERSDPVRVNDDAGAETGQEYHDLAVLPDGRIAIAWLDERGAPPDHPNEKQLWYSESADGGRTFSRNVRLTDSPAGVCPCCRPSIAASPEGDVHVLWRDRVGEELVLRTTSRRAGAPDFSSPRTLSAPWRFPGCPMNGPVVAAGAGGRVWTLWVSGRGDDDEGRLEWALSTDRGETFSAPAALGQLAVALATEPEGLGAPRSLSLSVDGSGRPLAAWESLGGRIWWSSLPLEPDGSATVPTVLASGSEALARSPAVLLEADLAMICWIEEDVDAWRSSSRAGPALPIWAPLAPDAISSGPRTTVRLQARDR